MRVTLTASKFQFEEEEVNRVNIRRWAGFGRPNAVVLEVNDINVAFIDLDTKEIGFYYLPDWKLAKEGYKYD